MEKTWKVYELINSVGTIEWVGETSRTLETRFKEHTKKKPYNGQRNGKFYGRLDLIINFVAEFNNRTEALELEGNLKREYGLEWTEYTKTLKGGGGDPNIGKRSVESGHLSKVRKLANQKNQEIISCIYCGKECNRLNHGRYHGEKCKLKIWQKI
jgi:predicted GIY-YIG superfamily endonuclease